MFANFELWSGGMVEHPTKVRQPRSNKGCLTCRRIKKKCDERRPVCGRCSSQSQSTCCWPRPAVQQSQTTAKSSPCATVASVDPKAAVESADRDQLILYAGSSALTLARPSGDTALGLCGRADIPTYAWDLLRRANRAIHGAYFDDYYSILVPSLPIILNSSSYLHSWLALGAILLEQTVQDGQWGQIALKSHTKAVHGLYTHLSSAQEPSEWAVCTLVLLHIYERYGSAHQPPSDAHARSIRAVFLRRYSKFPPTNTSQLLQLSSLIYRVAVINIFRPQSSDDPNEYHCLDGPVNIWASSRVSSGLWQHSLWIGLTPQVFNIVFKLSTLVRMTPLSPPWRVELEKLEDDITNYDAHLPLASLVSRNSESGRQDAVSSLKAQSSAAHCLYALAFRILVSKIRSRGIGQSHTCCSLVNSSRGLLLLKQLMDADFVTMTLLWPAIIVSLDASRPDDQSTTRMFLARLDRAGGSRSIASVRGLFDAAWEMHDDNMLGSDILFRRDMVAGVFL